VLVEQPANSQPGQPWIRHDYKFADAAAQMLVYDVDGDSLNDVVTAWHCHLYGLVWHKQVRGEAGQIGFQQHVILPSEPDLNSSDLRISQFACLRAGRHDGDGLNDILTGKRFWATDPKGTKNRTRRPSSTGSSCNGTPAARYSSSPTKSTTIPESARKSPPRT